MNNSTESNLAGETENSEIINVINVFNYLLYSLVIILGVPGNILVVWSLMSIRKEKVNKSYKILVINLAVNDILVALITAPFTITELAVGPNFPFGSVMCVLLYPLQTACFGAGVFNMVALNVHRYYVITYPTGFNSIQRITAIAVFLCWFVPTVITAVPYAVHLELKVFETEIVCGETWLEASSKAYTIYLFIVQYLLPLVVIATLNTLTIISLKRGRLFRLSSAKVAEDSVHAHKRIVKMLVVIVLIFALFGLPGQIMWLLSVFTDVDEARNYGSILSLVDIFPSMYCVLNPVVFFTYNIECHEKLKKFLSSTFVCCRYHWKGSRGLSSTIGTRNDAVVTLLPTTRISDSQDTSHSDGPRSDPYATAVPQYLLNKHKEDNSGKEANSYKLRHGPVPLALLSTLNVLCAHDTHRQSKSSDPPSHRLSHLLATAGDKELFCGSFVELLRTRSLNNDLMKHLDASPETAIIEESIGEAS